MEENLYWVWLSSLQGIGAVKKKRLIEDYKMPYNIFCKSETELRQIAYLTDKNIDVLTDKKYIENAKKHLEDIYKNDIEIIPINDENYFELLKDIYDPPIVLYAKGKVKKNEISIGVVGSRKATSYGLNVAYDISDKLASFNITITSGLARGVDTYAHKGALKNKNRTIAVLGCGLDIVYPYDNKALFEEIIQDGMVITEYLPKTKPAPYHFPARNRIISGISRGILVVEAGAKSGSLITADFALEQGRDVFAIPGNIGYKNSEGTNALIKDGARIVTSENDILEEILGVVSNKKDLQKVKKYDNLNKVEEKIIECLSYQAMHIDLIAKNTKLDIKEINSALIVLELKGIIKQNDGKIFQIA